MQVQTNFSKFWIAPEIIEKYSVLKYKMLDFAQEIEIILLKTRNGAFSAKSRYAV